MSDYVTIETCAASTAKILEKLDSIDKRLFRDNGTLSIQTRLDRHEQIIRALLWAVSIVGGGILLAALSFAATLFRHILGGGP